MLIKLKHLIYLKDKNLKLSIENTIRFKISIWLPNDVILIKINFQVGNLHVLISSWLWIKWLLNCFGNPIRDLRTAKREFKQSKVNKRNNNARGNLKIGDANDQTSLLNTLSRFCTFDKCFHCCWIWKYISFFRKTIYSLYNV